MDKTPIELAEERGYHKGYLEGRADAGSCPTRRCVLNAGHEDDHFYAYTRHPAWEPPFDGEQDSDA